MTIARSVLSSCFLLTAIAIAACDPAAEEATIDTSQDGPGWMEEEHGDMRVLAGFELDGGARAVFAVDDKTGDYGYIEYGDGRTSSPHFKSGADLTTLEKYLELAPEDAPVPIELVELEKDEKAWVLVEGRELVDGSIPEPMVVPQSGFRSAGYYCHSTLGDDRFEEDLCVSSGGSDKIEYCDPGTWSNLIRQYTGGTRERVFTYTAVCAEDDNEPWEIPGDGQIIHWYWHTGTDSWLQTYYDLELEIEGWWWVDWGGSSLYRRAQHTNDNAFSYVRGYSVFYDQP